MSAFAAVGVFCVSMSCWSAQGIEPVQYSHPVDAPVLEYFRPPPAPWSAGNRGIDYDTGPGTEVHAAAAGQVLFAGQVGGPVHVSVLHADGLRTSYSFLETATVTAGDRVAAGDVVGITAGPLHFGFRDPDDQYLDPLGLLGPGGARLVPGGDDGAVVPAAAPGLGELLWAVAAQIPQAAPGRRSAPLVRWMTVDTHPYVLGARMSDAYLHRMRRMGPCTAGDVSAPEPDERRLLVTVAGFGSDSADAGVDRLDTDALGFEADDVVRFSYGGGVVADAGGDLAGLEVSPYGPAESQQDLRHVAGLLSELLADISQRAPGVPIHLVAHSQGGLVARLALDSAPEEVASVVTIGSPHGGAPLAAAAESASATPEGRVLLAAVGALGAPVDPHSPAVSQMAPGSELLAGLSATDPPEGVHLATIAARGDPVVPAGRTDVAGAAWATVPVSGLGAHEEVITAPGTVREISLAQAGMAPTCTSAGEVAADVLAGESVEVFQGGLGALVEVAAGPRD